MKNKYIYLLIVFLLLLTIPYVISYSLIGRGYHFNGFLINPTDGHSYLAKMQLGRSGEWLFKLPYSSQPGEGVFLFIYYIVLGHIAGFLHLPNIFLFHVTRIINSAILFIVLSKLINIYVKENWSFFTLGLISFGSGLGWLGLILGLVSSDFTTPEIYPFLSSLTNPHFPLAIGLMLIIIEITRDVKPKSVLISTFLSILLLIIQPFCMVIVLGILGISILIEYKENIKRKLIQLVSVALPTMTFGIYLYLITKNNPALNSWNAQNLTPSPPVWDLLIALSPVILSATFGIISVIRSKDKTFYPMVIWVVLVIILAYIPLNLQRRFLIGLYIPICFLGIRGLTVLVEKFSGKIGKFRNIFFATAIPTNIILLFMSLNSVVQLNPNLVMKESLLTGLKWIDSNIPARSLVLTSPEIGLYVPAYTNDRVIYGHPYETANAQINQANVEAFFFGMNQEEQKEYLAKEGVEYILTMEDKRTGSMNYTPIDSIVVYQIEDVKIYSVKK